MGACLPDQSDGSDAPSLKLESFSAFTYDPVGTINRRRGRKSKTGAVAKKKVKKARQKLVLFWVTQGLRDSAGYHRSFFKKFTGFGGISPVIF